MQSGAGTSADTSSEWLALGEWAAARARDVLGEDAPPPPVRSAQQDRRRASRVEEEVIIVASGEEEEEEAPSAIPGDRLQAASAVLGALPAAAHMLSSLEEAVRCPMCGGLPRAPVSLRSCSHVFCSGCLRAAFTREQSCPVCHVRGSIADGELYVHGPLRHASSSLGHLRQILGSILGAAAHLAADTLASVPRAARPPRPALPHAVPLAPSAAASDDKSPADLRASLPPPLPLAHYAAITDKTLRTDLARWGFPQPISGRRDTLVARHREFGRLFNAARDDALSGAVPMPPHAAIAARVMQDERSRGATAGSATAASSASRVSAAEARTFRTMALHLIHEARRRRWREREAAAAAAAASTAPIPTPSAAAAAAAAAATATTATTTTSTTANASKSRTTSEARAVSASQEGSIRSSRKRSRSVERSVDSPGLDAAETAAGQNPKRRSERLSGLTPPRAGPDAWDGYTPPY